MKVNLKKLAQQKEALVYVQRTLLGKESGVSMKSIRELIISIEEMEVDLEMGGECVVELDKPRLEAIEERNKMLNFMKQNETD